MISNNQTSLKIALPFPSDLGMIPSTTHSLNIILLALRMFDLKGREGNAVKVCIGIATVRNFIATSLPKYAASKSVRVPRRIKLLNSLLEV